MNIIRIPSSCVANLDWELQQFDVKNAFLQENLKEEVCKEIHLGFDIEQIQGMQTEKNLVDFVKQLSPLVTNKAMFF